MKVCIWAPSSPFLLLLFTLREPEHLELELQLSSAQLLFILAGCTGVPEPWEDLDGFKNEPNYLNDLTAQACMSDNQNNIATKIIKKIY